MKIDWWKRWCLLMDLNLTCYWWSSWWILARNNHWLRKEVSNCIEYGTCFTINHWLENAVPTCIKVCNDKKFVIKNIKSLYGWAVHHVAFWLITWKMFNVCILDSVFEKDRRRRRRRKTFGHLGLDPTFGLWPLKTWGGAHTRHEGENIWEREKNAVYLSCYQNNLKR